MASTTAKILRGLVTGILVFAFFSGGVVKLTDKVSSKVHKEMRTAFVRFATVHPAVLFGFEINPEKYMKQIGMIEMAGATFLLFGPRPLKLFSCLTLSSVMVGAMYTLHKLDEPWVHIVPPAVFLFLLFLRLHFLLIGTPKKSEDKKTEKTD